MKNGNIKEIKEYKRNKNSKSKNEKPKKSNGNIFLGIIFILIALGGTYFLYINGFNFPFTQKNNKTTTITIDSGSQTILESYKDNIIYCNNSGIYAVNQKGELEWNVPMTLNNPFLYTNEKSILVGDRGGREVNIVTNYATIDPIKTDEPIITAKINATGYFAIVTEEKGYKGRLTVYNPKGQEIYRWHSVGNNIIDVAISNDGKKIAVSVLNTSKGTVSSGLIFFYVSEEEPYAATQIEDTLITNIKFYKNNSLIAFGDNQVMEFSPQGVRKWNIDFGDKKMSTYNIDSDSIIAIAFESEKASLLNNKSIVELFNRDGNKIGEYESDGKINRLVVKNRQIAFYQNRKIHIINTKGEEIATLTSKKDIKDIILLKERGKILVVSRNDMDVLEY